MSDASTQVREGTFSQEKLKNATVAVFGIGGVGSYTAEALARSGIGSFVLVDDDKVCLTNINRQLIAARSTVGKEKVEIMKQRILSINPQARVDVRPCFFTAETAGEFDFPSFDYMVDAIDTVSAKLVLVEKAWAYQVPIISCMGAGNKLDATQLEVADIYDTTVCPLAKVIRYELRRKNIPRLKVVYSKEPALTPMEDMKNSCKTHCVCPPGTKRKCTIRHQVPGSVAFVPSVAGLILAGEAVKDLLG